MAKFTWLCSIYYNRSEIKIKSCPPDLYLKYTTFHKKRYITVKIAITRSIGISVHIYKCVFTSVHILYVLIFVAKLFNREVVWGIWVLFLFKNHIVYNEKDFMEGTHIPSSPDQQWLVVGGVQGVGFSSFPLSTHTGSE